MSKGDGMEIGGFGGCAWERVKPERIGILNMKRKTEERERERKGNRDRRSNNKS